MKLYKLTLEHDVEDIGKEFYLVCNGIVSVVDFAKTLGIDHVDYEIISIQLVTNDVILQNEVHT